MKTFKGLTLVGTILLVLVAQGSAAGPTTSVYTVGALTVPGVNSGLVLKKGHPVTVTATGVVCVSGNSGCVGPNGNPSVDTTQSSFGGFVLPGAPAYGLVGRVGTGHWVQVGSGPTTLSGKGVLVFAVNDDVFVDNTGSFEVTVSTAHKGNRDCWPGWGHGDTNHEHCGPPGQAKKPSSSGQSSGTSHGSSGEHGEHSEHGNSPTNGNSSDKGGGPKRP
jgi:hypothetical protein